MKFIDVGQGNCVFIKCNKDTDSQKHFMIVDCGSATGSQGYTQETHEYVKGKIGRLEGNVTILVTHPDVDHFNKVEKVVFGNFEDGILKTLKDQIVSLTVALGGPLEEYFFSKTNDQEEVKASTEGKNFVSHILSLKAKRGWSTKLKIFSVSHNLEIATGGNDHSKEFEALKKIIEDNANGERAFSEFKKRIQDKARGNISKRKLYGEEGLLREGSCPCFDVEILSANAGQGIVKVDGDNKNTIINSNNNTNSVVLRLEHQLSHKLVVLTGDATGETTDQIRRFYGRDLISADILLASHHGAQAEWCNSQEWIDFIKPKTVVFSSGIRGDYLHPRCEASGRYYAGRDILPSGLHNFTCGTHKELPDLNTVFSSHLSFYQDISLKNSEGKPQKEYFKTLKMDKRLYSTHDSGTITVDFNVSPDEIKTELPRIGVIPAPKKAQSLRPRIADLPALSQPATPTSVDKIRGDTINLGASSQLTKLFPSPGMSVFGSTVASSTVSRARSHSSLTSPMRTRKAGQGKRDANLAEAKRQYEQGTTKDDLKAKYPSVARKIDKF